MIYSFIFNDYARILNSVFYVNMTPDKIEKEKIRNDNDKKSPPEIMLSHIFDFFSNKIITFVQNKNRIELISGSRLHIKYLRTIVYTFVAFMRKRQ